MSNSDNPKNGATFQREVLSWFENNYGKSFELEKKLLIGNPPKEHKFDIVDEKSTVAIECKRYTWTRTGNVPSAKMGAANEAAFYLRLLPLSYTKFIVMMRTYCSRHQESLAEYYFRTYKHLLGNIIVAEYDPQHKEMRFIQDQKHNNSTLDYYNQNANQFATGTMNAEMIGVQDSFVKYLPSKSRILDFGCGSGRDTKYFLNKGFLVDATDGSAELCRIASELTGISVRQMLFSELDTIDVYDGIWACSSILHCSKEELADVFHKMIRAVKDGGVIYTSFKYGEFEGERRGRYFTDFTEESFREFSNRFPELKIVEEHVSADVRPGRGDEKWLNIILRKQA